MKERQTKERTESGQCAPLASAQGIRVLRSGAFFVVFVISLTNLLAVQAHAQGGFPGAAELGAAVAQMSTRRWVGARVDAPAITPRPALPLLIQGSRVAVHGAGTVTPRVEHLAAELERFANYLSAGGFPAPLVDGGRGGSQRYDIYLTPTPAMRGAHSDGQADWAFYDRASAFGVVDPLTSGDDLWLCGVEAYARGLLLSLLPDEDARWRHAYAAWLTWRFTGRMGCADGAQQQQQESLRSWVGQGADGGTGGALFLAMTSERHSRGTGLFLRELLQIARQRTWEGTRLRASPDLWQALHVALDASGRRTVDLVSDLAMERYFLGLRAPWTMGALRDLGEGTSVPVAMETELSALPYHSPSGGEIAVYGSAYLRVDVRGATEGMRLRVWLRGEYGVEWHLGTVRLDAFGRPLGQLSAAVRPGDPRAYLPVELDRETATVIAVATNLSHRLPDADDVYDPNARAYRFIVDVARDDAEAP